MVIYWFFGPCLIASLGLAGAQPFGDRIVDVLMSEGSRLFIGLKVAPNFTIVLGECALATVARRSRRYFGNGLSLFRTRSFDFDVLLPIQQVSSRRCLKTQFALVSL